MRWGELRHGARNGRTRTQAVVSEWCGAGIGNGIRNGIGIGTPAERRGPALVVGGEALPVRREAPPQLGCHRGLLRLEELQVAQPVRAHHHVLEHLPPRGAGEAAVTSLCNTRCSPMSYRLQP